MSPGRGKQSSHMDESHLEGVMIGKVWCYSRQCGCPGLPVSRIPALCGCLRNAEGTDQTCAEAGEAPVALLRQLQSAGMSHLLLVCFQHGAGRVFSILWGRAYFHSIDLVCSGLLVPSFPYVSPKGSMLWGWGCPAGRTRECVGPWPQHRTLSPIRVWWCPWKAQGVEFGAGLNG